MPIRASEYNSGLLFFAGMTTGGVPMLASSFGPAEEGAREILASDTYVNEVRAAEQMFQRSGINAVPAVIINQRRPILGGQPGGGV